MSSNSCQIGALLMRRPEVVLDQHEPKALPQLRVCYTAAELHTDRKFLGLASTLSHLL